MTATPRWLRDNHFREPKIGEEPWWRRDLIVIGCRVPLFAKIGEPVADIVRRAAKLGVEIDP